MVLPLRRLVVPRQFLLTTQTPTRAFHYSRPLSLSEDKKEPNPQEIEKAKQEQLKDGKKKEELESASETGVKADREQVKDHDKHMEKLQKETARESEREKGKA